VCIVFVLHLYTYTRALSIVFANAFYNPPLGSTPSHECRRLPNESNHVHPDLVLGNSSLHFVYGQCAIDVYDNSSNYTHVAQMPCVNGYTYGRPRERSYVTEVIGIVPRMVTGRQVENSINIYVQYYSRIVRFDTHICRVYQVRLGVKGQICSHSEHITVSHKYLADECKDYIEYATV
jgi:hypothetical protein